MMALGMAGVLGGRFTAFVFIGVSFACTTSGFCLVVVFAVVFFAGAFAFGFAVVFVTFFAMIIFSCLPFRGTFDLSGQADRFCQLRWRLGNGDRGLLFDKKQNKFNTKPAGGGVWSFVILIGKMRAGLWVILTITLIM
jgi:hypothetical protein